MGDAASVWETVGRQMNRMPGVATGTQKPNA
jgi:hypothetical protein